MNPPLKGNAVRLEVALQIVTAHVERKTCRHAKQPVQRLRFHLNIFKLTLGHGITAIRAVPVAEINLLATRFARDAPVGNLMQAAGVKAMGKHNAVIRHVAICRKIDRFVIAFNQTGIKIIGKAAVKNSDQLLIMVLLLH